MVGAMLALIACAAKPVPFALNGVWDVVRVSPDQVDQPAWLYRPDEPALMGRELLVTPAAVSLDRDDCIKPRWTKKTSTWKALLRRSFLRPPKGERPRVPFPEDFDLKGPASKPLQAYFVSCHPGRANSQWGATWLVATGPTELILNYSGTAILTLHRRLADAKPKASFDCSKATTKTERTICASMSLAAWDRSVQLAWNWRLELTDVEKQPALRLEQQAWLKKRDACGADAQCLTDAMEERVGELR